MSLLDLITGGKSSDAEDILKQAQAAFSGIKPPTTEQLTLPELKMYVVAGVLTPAQAQAYLQNNNAYDEATGSQEAREAEMTALSQLQEVAQDKDISPALIQAITAANTNTAGQRGSIMDLMAQRGIPTSLMGAAMQSAAAGQDAQTANLVGAQAAGDAENRALQAIMESGKLAGNIENQRFGEQSQKAAAQNAINAWNAANQTQNSQFNAGNEQQANVYNTQTAQDVSGKNTGQTNYRTQYNAQVPQQVFQNSIQKATGQSGAAQAQANQLMQSGQQEAGLIAGILGGASQVGASAAAPRPVYASEGGQVPGEPRVSGDSPQNDTVPARLSPGEIVLPRTVAGNPDRAKQFVEHLLQQRRTRVHPRAVDDVLSALSRHHSGGAA